MRSNLRQTIAARAATLIAIGAAALAVGCNSGNPRVGSASYKTGELGNGAFLFLCDDSVACDRWSNSAKDFPEQVASGATFELRFVARGEEGSQVDLNGPNHEGVTISSVGPYVGRGSKGFAGVKPGYGMLVAKDAQGRVVDYTAMRVVQPDALAVIDADQVKATVDPPRLGSVDMSVGARRDIVALAEYQKETVAGAFKVEWTSSDPSVAVIESYTRGVAKVLAKGPGSAKLLAKGGGLEREIVVEVTP